MVYSVFNFFYYPLVQYNVLHKIIENLLKRQISIINSRMDR